MRFEYDICEMTHIGGRPVNEDSIGHYVGNNGTGFVLCDGLGGHGMGDAASQLVRDVFISQYKNMDKPSKVLAPAFQSAQDILTAEQECRNATSKMKTTATAIACDDKKAYLGHIGDSRIYVFNEKGVMKRTMDHSVPQMLALAKDIKDEDIRTHPDRSSLLKVMGMQWDDAEYDLMRGIPLRKCKAFLMCTDGFWELIEDSEMVAALESSSSSEEWMKKMDAMVKERGLTKGEKMDNNSAIAVIVNKVK